MWKYVPETKLRQRSTVTNRKAKRRTTKVTTKKRYVDKESVSEVSKCPRKSTLKKKSTMFADFSNSSSENKIEYGDLLIGKMRSYKILKSSQHADLES